MAHFRQEFVNERRLQFCDKNVAEDQQKVLAWRSLNWFGGVRI